MLDIPSVNSGSNQAKMVQAKCDEATRFVIPFYYRQKTSPPFRVMVGGGSPCCVDGRHVVLRAAMLWGGSPCCLRVAMLDEGVAMLDRMPLC